VPLYEYACQKCSHVFEELVLRGEEPTACPECGGAKLERLVSTVGARMGESAESRVAYAHTDYGKPRKPPRT
jgi:putative FmdB family regulatory protein